MTPSERGQIRKRGYVKRGRGFYISAQVIGDRLFVSVSVGGARWRRVARLIAELMRWRRP